MEQADRTRFGARRKHGEAVIVRFFGDYSGRERHFLTYCFLASINGAVMLAVLQIFVAFNSLWWNFISMFSSNVALASVPLRNLVTIYSMFFEPHDVSQL